MSTYHPRKGQPTDPIDWLQAIHHSMGVVKMRDTFAKCGCKVGWRYWYPSSDSPYRSGKCDWSYTDPVRCDKVWCKQGKNIIDRHGRTSYVKPEELWD